MYYADFMQRQWPHLRSRRIKAALDEIEIDFENVRAAWRMLRTAKQERSEKREKPAGIPLGPSPGIKTV